MDKVPWKRFLFYIMSKGKSDCNGFQNRKIAKLLDRKSFHSPENVFHPQTPTPFIISENGKSESETGISGRATLPQTYRVSPGFVRSWNIFLKPQRGDDQSDQYQLYTFHLHNPNCPQENVYRHIAVNARPTPSRDKRKP
ncbi:MAG: hypothetical protein IJZ13_03295 [Clostridia bacterium]|nr:hypothetical protein [Clostridia bacterium]